MLETRVDLKTGSTNTAKGREETTYSHLRPTHLPPRTPETGTSPLLLPPALSDSCPRLPLLRSSPTPLSTEQKHPPKRHRAFQHCSVTAFAEPRDPSFAVRLPNLFGKPRPLQFVTAPRTLHKSFLILSLPFRKPWPLLIKTFFLWLLSSQVRETSLVHQEQGCTSNALQIAGKQVLRR